MGAADSFAGKTLADTAAQGENAPRAVGPESPASASAGAVGNHESERLCVSPDPTLTDALLNPTDHDHFILQDEPTTASGSPPSEEGQVATEVRRTVVAPASGDRWGGDPVPGLADHRAAPKERPLPVISGYDVLGELGRGGMGVVYQARQILLNRPCVLKMILAGAHAGAEAVVRFLAEAEAVARMQHANIVQIYHIGEVEGLPFFELEFLRGGSLDRRLDGTPWPSQKAAELIEAAARGVAEAHRLGLVHRDLKPANVLLTAEGTPKITDFGLAKSLTSDSGLTRTDLIMGSPGYMAPEQAQGRTKEVGPQADVYALGAMLYELLTGRPPFRAATVLETLEQVKNAEAVPPGKLQPGLARDLDTICLKSLQKDPARRYATAGDLADDLERWLSGAPINARPIPFWERCWRWAKHRPAVAALSALIVLISAVSFALVATLWARAEERAKAAIVARDRADRLATQESEARGATQRERQNAVDSLYRSLLGEARALRLARKTGYRLQVLELIKVALHSDARSRDVEELRREAVACMGDFVGSQPGLWADLPRGVLVTSMAAHPGSLSVALGYNDGTVSIRDLPQGTERARLRGHDARVSDLAFVPHGRTLISVDASGAISVWDAGKDNSWSRTRTIKADPPGTGYRVGKPLYLAVTADGKTLAVCSALAPFISLWDTASGTPAGRLSVPGPEQLTCLALSPDGKHLAAGYRSPLGHGALIWNMATSRVKQRVTPDLELVLGIAFSPGGQWLACACSEGVALFDAAQFERRLFIRGDIPAGVAFSRNDQVLAIPAEKLGILRLWDVSVNREAAVLDCPHTGGAVTFTPDGRHLIASSGEAVRLWTPWQTSEKLTLPGHTGGIPGIASNRDGTLLASAGKDRTVRIWDAASGRLIKALSDFRGPVQAVAFTPSGRRLVTAEFSGEIRIWDLATSMAETLPDPGLGRPLWSINFTANGRYFWAQGSPQSAIWKVRHGEQAGDDPGAPMFEFAQVVPSTYDGCLGPDGKRIASATKGRLEVLELPALRSVFSVPYSYPSGARHLAFGPDGRLLMSLNRGYEIEVWDTATGQKTATFGGDPTRTSNATISLSPDGLWFAEANRAVTVWDLAHGRAALVLPETRNSVWSMTWIPGQNRLAVGTSDGELVIWNLDRVRSNLAALGLDH